jgi:hypothetical protein
MVLQIEDSFADGELLDLKLWTFEAVILGLMEALTGCTAGAVTDGELLALLGALRSCWLITFCQGRCF